MTIEFFSQQSLLKRIAEPLRQRMDDVITKGNFIQGAEVAELENALADIAGVKHCIGVSNGSDALLLALMAAGVTRGDEVITPAFSYIAAAESVRLLGATPVYVEVEERTYNLDASRLKHAVSEKTKAIVVIDMFGQVADYDAVEAVVGKSGIVVIEDAAQSFGATRAGKKAGAFGRIATTSFFPTKPLGCFGDGGALFTNDSGLAVQLRQIALHGQSEKYRHERLGINARLDTLQAAVLLAKLPEFEFELEQRREAAAYYDELVDAQLANKGVSSPYVEASCRSVYAQYTLCVEKRDELRRQLLARGIPTAVHYPVPIYSQWSGVPTERLPVTEKLCNRVLSLPFYPGIARENQRAVIRSIGKALA